MPTNLTDYRHIFLNDVPMMDVRAPVEFGQGAFPGVANLPLMDDGERQQVGTCYKHKGQEAAIALGHQLVSGSIKRQRAFHLVYFCLGLRQLGQCGRLGLAHQRLGRQRNGQLDPQGVCIRLSSRAAVAHHAQGQLG